MRIKGLHIVGLLAILFALGTGSCRKTQRLTMGGVLKFSDDTLKFDTVFTAAGSFTTGVLIYNPQGESIVVSSIKLQSGDSSYFHLNVDGVQGNYVPNIKIAPHDSVYVFATVNIDPTDTLTPFLITDRLIATLNGKEFSIPFTAYGQNAHYIIGDSLATSTTWLTDKPYVVIHNLIVGPNAVLTIPAKCRVYMHQDARVIIYNELRINPTKGDSVVFQGDRLDRRYFGYIGYPGEWCGLWFVPGSLGIINNTVLKNCGGNTAYWGYTAFPAALRVDNNATVLMDHSVIKNSIGFGIYNWQGSIIAINCLFHTTGAQALASVQGGNDSFVNCTFANYGTKQLSHSTESTVALLNYFKIGDSLYLGQLNASLQNCIVYGSLDSEAIFDTVEGTAAKIVVKNCLLKMGTIREPFISFSSTVFNQDPMFKDPAKGDFHLTAGSPAINAGASVPGITTDLDGKAWSGTDIGCYKYAP